MKKLLALIIAIVAVIVGYWLISPLFIDNQVDEVLDTETQAAIEAAIQDFRDNAENTNIAEQIDEEEQEELFEEMAKMEDEIIAEPMPESAPSANPTSPEPVKEEVPPVPEPAQPEPIPTPEPAGPQVLSTGSFKTVAHTGSGKVKIIDLGGDKGTILRFEDLDVDNGPDLRVLLSPNSNIQRADDLGNKIELGKLKGNQGTQNYTIPSNINIDDYKSVIIYCKPFRVVFNTAELQ